tara:strand:+ start:517 stop:873 length:357 start_codon:yes stop_codon:yes gene_type:complete
MGKPKNYGWSSNADMMINRRHQDNKQKKIAYWRNKYKFDICKDDYDQFINKIPIIKKVYLHLEKYLAYDKAGTIPGDDLEFYALNYDKIKLVENNREYLSQLKRIELTKSETPIIVTF